MKKVAVEKNRKGLIKAFIGDKLSEHRELLDSFDSSYFLQNAIDMLRVISVPTAEDFGELSFLVDRDAALGRDDPEHAISGSDDSDHEETNETEKEPPKKLMRSGKVAKKTTPGSFVGKKNREMSTSEKLRHIPCYKTLFAKSWLLLLSLPLTKTQHKIVLKHLPEHVIPDLPQPLLIADYLTDSFNVRVPNLLNYCKCCNLIIFVL